MKLLILGGTGVISRAIVAQAIDKGFDVTMVNRGNRPAEAGAAVRTIQADRSDKAAFAASLKDVEADVVIDMIAFDAKDAAETLALFRNRARQIIVTSSVAGYRRPYRSLPSREDMERPLLDSPFAYGRLKAELDQYLLGEMNKPGAAITIIRPSLTFGPGARNFGMLRQNYNVVQRIRDRKPLVMTGEGTASWCFTYVDDLALGFVLACGNERTYNDHFHIVSDELVVWEDLYRFVGELVGEEPILNYVPSALLREVDGKLLEHLYYEKSYCNVFCCDKFKKAAPDFRASWSIKDGLARLIESWERDGLGVDAEKDALEDGICARYAAFRGSLFELQK